MALRYLNVLKQKKIYILFLIIFLVEFYYFKNGGKVVESSIDMYIYTLKGLFEKGFLIIIYLFLLTSLTRYFDKPFILTRYYNINSIKKDFLSNSFLITIFFVLIINILPITLIFISKNIFYKEIFLLIIYLFVQLASLLIINYIYMNIFFRSFKHIYANSLIFLSIYLPTFFLYSFRKDYLTPVDLIFFKNSISLNKTIFLINIYILILVLIGVSYSKKSLKREESSE